jgi:hypothetical protein
MYDEISENQQYYTDTIKGSCITLRKLEMKDAARVKML